MKIIFYGTPEFAVPCLEILLKNGYDVVAVVTAPDKPAGRGLKPGMSAIKEFALDHALKILQPLKLKDPVFLDELKQLAPDLQIVVAFRKMPEEVWAFPTLGTFNLHGSLLPQYRGAAPIQRAVMNGEKETGITTFFLEKEIDTGKIIFRESISIGDAETSGELHDRMSLAGAQLVLKTVQAIEKGNVSQKNQSEFVAETEVLKEAPKIHKPDCRIDWKKNGTDIFNQIRGLSPFPGAFTSLVNPSGKALLLKIYKAEFKPQPIQESGHIQTDLHSYFGITCNGGLIRLLEVQLEGKKKMALADFLRGSRIDTSWKAE